MPKSEVDPVAVRLAARLWTLPETSHIVMDSDLCAALALEFEGVLRQLKKAYDLIQYSYGGLSSGHKATKWLRWYEGVIAGKDKQ